MALSRPHHCRVSGMPLSLPPGHEPISFLLLSFGEMPWIGSRADSTPYHTATTPGCGVRGDHFCVIHMFNSFTQMQTHCPTAPLSSLLAHPLTVTWDVGVTLYDGLASSGLSSSDFGLVLQKKILHDLQHTRYITPAIWGVPSAYCGE